MNLHNLIPNYNLQVFGGIFHLYSSIQFNQLSLGCNTKLAL